MRPRAHSSPTKAPADRREKQVLPYGGLIVAIAAVVAAAAIAAAYFAPSGEPELQAESLPTIELPLLRQFSAEPTIELPSTAAKIDAEPLRQELLDLSGELVNEFPDAPEALHVAASLHAELNLPARALELWQSCLALGTRDSGPFLGLANAASSLGKDELAISTLEKALAAGISVPELYHDLAAALSRLGRADEAAKIAKAGVEKFPQEGANWLQLGQTQLQLGNFADAEASLRQALAGGHEAPAVFFALATACARQDKRDEAAQFMTVFQQSRQKQPVTSGDTFQSRYDEQLRGIAVATLAQAGAIYRRRGDLKRAEQLYLRACQLDPMNSAVLTELVTLFRSQERIADARLVQQRLLESEPRVVFHHVNYASLSEQVGAASEAEASLKKAIAMRPDLAVGYAGLAQLYLRQENAKDARWFAEAALRQQASSPEEMAQTCLVLAAACGKLGDTAAAAAALEQAQQRAPRSPPSRLEPSRLE
jgi:tetratricopeptide (TPR) repeat protein